MHKFEVGNVIQFTQGMAMNRFAQIVKIEDGFRITYNLYGWEHNQDGAHALGTKGQYYRYFTDPDWVSVNVVAPDEDIFLANHPDLARYFF
jgi:hypothetical protein